MRWGGNISQGVREEEEENKADRVFGEFLASQSSDPSSVVVGDRWLLLFFLHQYRFSFDLFHDMYRKSRN